MNSRVHPKYVTRYRLTNRADYDKALVKRGDLTLWISPAAVKAWAAKPTGQRGAPQKWSDLAIETALTIRRVFQLPLRQAEGFLRAPVNPMDLILDGTGFATVGEGNWAAAKHGKRGKRG